ncbi:MAG: glutamate--tRNA ligase [bacterium]|nr:glutamate--tRNA ligase [bacterium]
MSVRVRFAPSPTGELHIGGLRTALYDWLWARKQNGAFVLRIDDTDRTRFVDGAEERIVAFLSDFGLTPDESPQIGGPYAPYRQSDRFAMYREAADRLLASGACYRCFCTTERIDAMQAARRAQKLPPRYDRHCRSLTKVESDRRALTEPFTIRIAMPDKEVVVHDELRGDVRFQPGSTDDTILIKSDGWPTYHIATIVDDYAMKISDVLRGEEWLPSLPIHKVIAEQLGYSQPRYYHTGLLVDAEGKKLSKRTGGATVAEWLQAGIPREALLNVIARLGWDPQTNELLSLEQMVERFELSALSTHSTMFSDTSFQHFTREAFTKLSVEQLAQQWQPLAELLPFDSEGVAFGFAKEEANSFHDITSEMKYWIDLKSGVLPREQSDPLPEGFVSSLLETEDLSLWLKGLSKATGLKGKELWMSLRRKITGREHGPELIRICNYLGRERVLQLLQKLN